MRTIFVVCLLVSISLSGCSLDGGVVTNKECEVAYSLHTFPINGIYKLRVDKIRINRFGQMDVHPQKGQHINFVGSGWLKPNEYKDINCGLRY